MCTLITYVEPVYGNTGGDGDGGSPTTINWGEINGSLSSQIDLQNALNLKANVSALNTLNASNLTSGTVSDARLSGNVTLQGNTFNAANKLLKLDGSGLIPSNLMPISAMEIQGAHNVITNTPTLIDGVGNPGDIYEITHAGIRNYGSGNIELSVGDWLVYGSLGIWYRSENLSEVTGFLGRKGNIIPASGDYTASQITNVPAGSIGSTDVQSALNELDSDLANKISASSTDTLTNKTINGASNTLTNIAQSSITNLTTDLASKITASSTDILTNKTISSSNTIGNVAMLLGSDSTGDIYYRNASGILTRLAIGTAGQVLQVLAGLPSWATPNAIPSGTDTQTVRFNGTSLVANSFFKNNGTNASFNGLIDSASTLIAYSATAGVNAITADMQVGNIAFQATLRHLSAMGLRIGATNTTANFATFGTSAGDNFEFTESLLSMYGVDINFKPKTSGTARSFKFYESQVNGNNFFALKAPDSLTADCTMSLPNGLGTNGQVFTTDGAGGTSWTTPTSSLPPFLLATSTMNSLNVPGTSYVDLSGLVVTLVANATYKIEVSLMCTSPANTTCNIFLSYTGTASLDATPTYTNMPAYINRTYVDPSGAYQEIPMINTYNTGVFNGIGSSGTSRFPLNATTSSQYFFKMTYYIRTTSAGTYQLRAAQVTGATGNVYFDSSPANFSKMIATRVA